jgi:hypothetical protein
MTDYLTRLAQRTLGLFPVAEPLITPSFSSFTSKMHERPVRSINEHLTFSDQQVFPGTQEQEQPQDFSKPRSKVQKTARSKNELPLEKAQPSVAGNANDFRLLNQKNGADDQDQRHPETNFMNLDAISIHGSVHIEKQVPSKDIVIAAGEIYEEQENDELSDPTPKHLKNSRHRRNPEMTVPKIEKEIGPKIENEMTGPISEKEMKDTDIPDTISVSKDLEYPFSEKYVEARPLQDITSEFKKENRLTADIFPENYSIKESNSFRRSNLNKNLNPDSTGQESNPDQVTSEIHNEREKLISSDPPPSGKVMLFAEKDRSIVRDQEHYEMRTDFTNVINPVIKISHEENHTIKDIHAKTPEPPIPTIKVTIGRVEVRAVPQPQVHNPSPAMKKPVLSLDEYLKQHNG